MKKVLFPTLLILVAIASWAFYPKAAEPGGYMMVIGNLTFKGLSAEANVTTITADGQQSEKVVEVKVRSAEKLNDGFTEVQKVALAQINLLSKSGWQLANTTPATLTTGGTTRVNQVIYVLEKH
jgi:hypothetical protein